jgi:tRNA pseudouridine38-40 synthase
MAYYRSIIAYDGTDFQGFQRLGGDRRTVQGVFEDALRGIGWEGRSLRAAGRTDAGVHARGQVVDYDLAWKHDPGLLTLALNSHLPKDVAVRATDLANPGFHPRFSARRRRYRYALVSAPERDPLRERYAWRIWPAPDPGDMAKAAGLLLGERDFGALGPSPIPGGHTVREVFSATWHAEPEALVFEIEANAFLYRMVRRLVALMLEVGSARMTIGEFEAVLAHPEQPWAGKIAPARGLCLEAVVYDE